MILTFTPNPSLDKTVELDAPLSPGAVQRAPRTSADPGGKGVNVSRALSAAGVQTRAILPGDPGDPVLTGLDALDVASLSLPIGTALRTNITIADPDGTTTKINEAGPQFSAEDQQRLVDLVLEAAPGASWVVLAGSLPPGLPTDFYAQLIVRLRTDCGDQAPRLAVDTSGPPLAAGAAASPDLIKPNAEELLELVELLSGRAPEITAEELESDPAAAAALAREAQAFGVRAALVTLGAHGAVYVPASSEGAEPIRAWGPPIVARSTVGAGDASLAGFLLADQAGDSPEHALRYAMGMGRAAAELPGSAMPTPDLIATDIIETHLVNVEITP
jgi:1-phosphofructokinase